MNERDDLMAPGSNQDFTAAHEMARLDVAQAEAPSMPKTPSREHLIGAERIAGMAARAEHDIPSSWPAAFDTASVLQDRQTLAQNRPIDYNDYAEHVSQSDVERRHRTAEHKPTVELFLNDEGQPRMLLAQPLTEDITLTQVLDPAIVRDKNGATVNQGGEFRPEHWYLSSQSSGQTADLLTLLKPTDKVIFHAPAGIRAIEPGDDVDEDETHNHMFSARPGMHSLEYAEVNELGDLVGLLHEVGHLLEDTAPSSDPKIAENQRLMQQGQSDAVPDADYGQARENLLDHEFAATVYAFTALRRLADQGINAVRKGADWAAVSQGGMESAVSYHSDFPPRPSDEHDPYPETPKQALVHSLPAYPA